MTPTCLTLPRMTYEEAIAFWYGRIDFEKKPAQPGDLKLDRMRLLLRLLGDPHHRLRIVHVTGTKGKGSTSAMLAACVQSAGYRVGLYTSPHLADVSERIQVNGEPISQLELTVRMREVAKAVQRMEAGGDPTWSPTFFEIGTALGFLHFDCRRVDLAIVEVGLGGRFDSTNVCLPLLSMITSISFDHMAQLGNTLEKIAFEKAGIIKHRRPVVTTATPPAQAVIENVAIERHSPIVIWGRDFQVEHLVEPYPRPSKVRVTTRTRTWPEMALRLPGNHQAINAAGVIAATEILRDRGFVIPDESVARGLAEVHWPARIEVLGKEPLLILDCAHNVASTETLVVTLDEVFPVSGTRTLVFAVSSDKQVREIVSILTPHFEYFVLTRFAKNPRCVPPQFVAELVRNIRPNASIVIEECATDALRVARQITPPHGRITITGSVFLAGDLRAQLLA